MFVELLLGISWLVCWYFFFVRYRPAVPAAALASTVFTLTSCAVFVLLVFWSALMWGIQVRLPQLPVLMLGAALTVSGQLLMCAARRELPLSNWDVLMRIGTVRVHSGVYRRMSHPMYMGLLLALFGSAVMLGNVGALAVSLLLVPLLFLRAVIESAHDICCGHGISEPRGTRRGKK